MRNRTSTAVLTTKGLTTVYRRWGSGRTVLLLGVSDALALALGDSFRVIVPELPLGFSDFEAAQWLGDVCEGLGIVDAVIVAEAALRDAASQIANDAPERVTGVIIVDLSTRDGAGIRAAVEQAFS
jgi:pimeloyl-ACP methyl ester carboxylesterase